MNESFFGLPQEKRKNLINAGYKAFAGCPYKNASMAMAAGEAGLSKSLLFYYFRNKKEYYLFLFDTAVRFLQDEKKTEPEKADLFELVNRTVERRLAIMREYPYLMKFTARAYYETEKSVEAELRVRKEAMARLGIREALERIDVRPLLDPDDAKMLVTIILTLAEGCMRGQEELDGEKIDAVVPLFAEMMRSLKSHYYRREERSV